MNRIKTYLNKYHLPLYKQRGLPISQDEVRKIISKSISKAKKQYSKLKEPKTISEDLYIDYWVRKRLVHHSLSQHTKSVTIDDPPDWIKTAITFTELYSKELQAELHDKIYQSPFSKRPQIWQHIEKKRSIPEIKTAFQEMMYYRVTQFTKEKGYNQYIDLYFDKYQVPKSAYQDFLDGLQPAINFCNKKLPNPDQLPDWFYSPLTKPCFSCLQTISKDPLPFSSLTQAVEQMAKIHPLLDKFKDKVNLKQAEKYETIYQEETDNFEITLVKSEDKRHQITSLIHELAHVVNYLASFQNGINPQEKGTYWRERETFRIELGSLKKIAPSLLVNRYTNTLNNFTATLFDIDLYSKPRQNLDKLYANKFNHCFKSTDQKENPTWILKENIVFHPFSLLPYSISQFQIINNQLNQT